jgi:hypothetical protein
MSEPILYAQLYPMIEEVIHKANSESLEPKISADSIKLWTIA